MRASATLLGIGSVRRAQKQKSESSAVVYRTPCHTQPPPPRSVKCHAHDQPLLSVRPHSMLAAVLGMCGESSVKSARPEAANHKHHHKHHHTCSDMMTLMSHSTKSMAGKIANRKDSDRRSGSHHHSQRTARQYQLTHCRPKAVAAVEGGMPPLRERGNTLRRERSEYDYCNCTPAKREFGRREIQLLHTLQPVSHEDVRRTLRDKENNARASVREVWQIVIVHVHLFMHVSMAPLYKKRQVNLLIILPIYTLYMDMWI